ncbi:MAG: DNA cytosine methyltransferase [Prevotella sp.]|nr:DNA cytosine methyltransferase [Prevotella sp.]
MKIIDLFCGIGGLSLGFEQAGFEVISAIDMWKDAVVTYNHNRKEKVAKVETVEEFNEKELPSIISNQHITGIIGGPPCQGFSTVGRRVVDDPRNKMYLEFYKAVKLAKPDFFLIENVKGMLTLNKGAFVKDLIERFGPKGLGYNITYELLNAADYGIPQNRYRVFYVGILDKKYEFPQPFKYQLTAKDGISDLEGADNEHYGSEPKNDFQREMRGGCKHPLNQDYTSHTEQTINIISKVPDGGNIRDLPREVWEVRKYNKAFERMGTFKPSNTIDTGHRNYFHYSEPRIPTVRESARIQSFPDDFEIVGTRGSQYKQVGNAVPPMLAKVIAEQIKKIII